MFLVLISFALYSDFPPFFLICSIPVVFGYYYPCSSFCVHAFSHSLFLIMPFLSSDVCPVPLHPQSDHTAHFKISAAFNRCPFDFCCAVYPMARKRSVYVLKHSNVIQRLHHTFSISLSLMQSQNKQLRDFQEFLKCSCASCMNVSDDYCC